MQSHFMDRTDAGGNQAPGSVWVFKKEQFVASQGPANKPVADLRPGERVAGGNGNQAGLNALALNGFISPETLQAPRLAARNVAAWRVADKLGWPVIVKSEFAARTIPLTDAERMEYAQRNGVMVASVPRDEYAFGLMMQRVTGKYGVVEQAQPAFLPMPVNGEALSPEALQERREIDANIRRTSVQLQLIDAIIGQADRHLSNFMIDANGNMVGIDNDQCFPDRVEDPNVLADGKYLSRNADAGLRGLALPRVIDEEQKARIDGLSAQDLRAALNGLLTQKEIEAAVKRLKVVKQHVNSSEVKVIRKDQWADDDTKALLMTEVRLPVHARNGVQIVAAYDKVDSSYYGRLLHDQLSFKA
jgi:hypothetical protein